MSDSSPPNPPAVPPTVPRPNQLCFLVNCRDAPESANLRAEHLDGHLRHVETHWQRYVTAGPLREPGGDALIGSLFLIMADSISDAQALMAGDPYVRCGMYQSIEYKEFTNSIGRYIGGKIWPDTDSIRHRAAGGPSLNVDEGLS